MEVNPKPGEPYRLGISVLVRAREVKKCAGVIDLNLSEYIASNNYNFRLQLPLTKCPDPKALLAFEFRCIPIDERTRQPSLASPAQNASIFRPSSGSMRVREVAGSGPEGPQRMRSSSPSNVKVHFGQAMNRSGAGAQLLRSASREASHAKLNLSLRGEKDSHVAVTHFGAPREPLSLNRPMTESISQFTGDRSSASYYDQSLRSLSNNSRQAQFTGLASSAVIPPRTSLPTTSDTAQKLDQSSPHQKTEIRVVQDPHLLAIRDQHLLCPDKEKELRSKTESLMEKLKLFQEELQRKANEEIGLQKRIEGDERRITSLEKTLVDMAQKLSESEFRLVSKDQESFELQSSHLKEVADLTDHLKEVETSLAKALVDLDSRERKINELSKNLAKFEEKKTYEENHRDRKNSERLEEQLEHVKHELKETIREQESLRVEKMALEMRLSSYQDERIRKDEELKKEKRLRMELEREQAERLQNPGENSSKSEEREKELIQIEIENRKLLSVNRSLEKELEVLKSTIEEKEAEIGQLKKELDVLQKETDFVKRDNKQLRDQQIQEAKELEEARQKIDELNRRAEEITESTQDGSKDDSKLREALAQVEELQAQLQQTNDQLGELKIKELFDSQKQDDLAAEIEGLNTRLQEKESEIAELSTEISRLQTDSRVLNPRISQRSCAENDDLALALAEADNLRKKVRTLEFVNGELGAAKSELEKQNRAATIAREEANDFRHQLSSIRSELEEKINKSKNEIERLQALNSETEGKLFVYINKLSEALNFVQEQRINNETKVGIIQKLI